MARLRLVVLGLMGRSPFGGQTWLYLNWLQGLRRLGHDVWYVEDDIVWPYDPEANAVTEDCSYAVRHIARCLDRIGMSDRWAFRFSLRRDHCWGLAEHELDELYRSSDALLNICGATELREEHQRASLRVFVETDPVTVELRRANGDEHTRNLLDAHNALATYGENYGTAACLVPLDGLTFVKTRQPVDLTLWPGDHRPDTRSFTTIGNYRQRGRDVTYQGRTYRWSKHHEWEVFASLPRLCGERFDLALVASDRDKTFLESYGWRVVPALPMSLDVFGAYPEFIRSSRAEFSVAKDQNVRLRSGWFSERDACYLASGKPVVAQDTGFGCILPTGDGLFAVGTVDEAASAISEIDQDYGRHARAARTIAEEYFDATVVAGALLRDLGLT
jgi:hypothetical protein